MEEIPGSSHRRGWGSHVDLRGKRGFILVLTTISRHKVKLPAHRAGLAGHVPVKAGHLGHKTGKGWYEYNGDGTRKTK